MNNYWNRIENFQRDGRIETMSRLNIRGIFEEKIDRRSRHYPWSHSQDSGITQRSQFMNDSKDFKDAESVRSGQSHVTSQPAFFSPFQNPGGMLSRSLGMPSRNEGPPSIWSTHGVSGNVFANPEASSSAPYPQESNPWRSNVSEHTSPHVRNESQTLNTAQDQRCQSGPSAGNSFVPSEGRFSQNHGQTNHDCRFRILILTNSPRQRHLLAGR